MVERQCRDDEIAPGEKRVRTVERKFLNGTRLLRFRSSRQRAHAHAQGQCALGDFTPDAPRADRQLPFEGRQSRKYRRAAKDRLG